LMMGIIISAVCVALFGAQSMAEALVEGYVFKLSSRACHRHTHEHQNY